MNTAFDDASPIQHQDIVRVHDRGQTVRDYEGGDAGADTAQAFLNTLFGGAI